MDEYKHTDFTRKMNTRYVGTAVPRVDALDKSQGKTKYMSDIDFPGMLWGRVLRAKYPHAQILNIDTSEAECFPGVVCVLTHMHVMGLNGLGIVVPDQPVLCADKVRFVGDAVALVAAESKEIAAKALELIKVDYLPLPVVDTPEKALAPEAPQIHTKGNILHKIEIKKGDPQKGFAESDIIIEQNYNTQMMDHAFLETESGVGVYHPESGVITIYCGAQYAYRDQLQIARALNWDPEKIHEVASPVGGAFGGKDEITIQIWLALLAYYTRPVKIALEREESFITHVKRHSMQLHFKLGASAEGKLKSLAVDIISDAGAYSSLSGPVLNLAIEGAPGPYIIPNTHLQGKAVHTNNLNSGAFRGFGTTQSCFAMEITVDMLAKKLNIDPLELRLKNVLRRGDLSGIDHKIASSVGIEECLKIAIASELWQTRKLRKKDYQHPYYFGVGAAAETQALGLGKGIPDYAGARIELEPDGKFLVRQGNIEIGQGNLTAFYQMAADSLQCDIDRINVIHGNTAQAPDSGSTTASKTIYLVGSAIYLAALRLIEKLEKFATDHFGEHFKYAPTKLISEKGTVLSLEEIARVAEQKKIILSADATFIHPESDKSYDDGLPHWLYAYIVQIAAVVVDTETGEVIVKEVLNVPDVGRAINIQGVEGQCEGGVMQGLGYALFEEVKLKQGHILNNNFSTYIIGTAKEAPQIQNTIIVESFEESHPFGAKGMAEPPNVAIAPAILNAIYDAVGVRIFSIPATPEKILTALKSPTKTFP